MVQNLFKFKKNEPRNLLRYPLRLLKKSSIIWNALKFIAISVICRNLWRSIEVFEILFHLFNFLKAAITSLPDTEYLFIDGKLYQKSLLLELTYKPPNASHGNDLETEIFMHTFNYNKIVLMDFCSTNLDETN